MNWKIFQLSKDDFQRGLQAFQNKNIKDTSNYFWNALNCLDVINDDKLKYDALHQLALDYFNLGFYDLALLASNDTIKICKKFNDKQKLAVDLITQGNIQMHLNNLNEAIIVYNNSLEICLKINRMDNAAAVSVNIATILAERKKYSESKKYLYSSLDYLKQNPHADIEKKIYLALIQILGISENNPEEIINIAKLLLSRFENQITKTHLDIIYTHIDNAVNIYLKDNPEIDEFEWKKKYFPFFYN